jgi:predicted SnoaL-like aldol condensation-catalyzing enzyme
MTDDSRSPKEVAVQFLELVVAGRIDEAYERFVDMAGKHHNPYFPAGFPALKQAMIENHAQFPEKRIAIKHIVAEGDMVAAHSQVVLNPGDKNIAVVHLFRFQGDRIVELWDIGQPIEPDSPNRDGMF